ncbi:MAG: hypothetical protein GY724_08745 [Actinomycetia bacterium]|nr:hypothetical protein [Actinomycetes bacterium]MCP4225001.1 hypothetical protein [Actinomycetes bacterium]MCP5034629.1 hypothetical protein [Actinomycetes bacterium]
MAAPTIVDTNPSSQVSERPAEVPHTTVVEDWVALAIGLWMIGGVFLDGYAHVFVIDTETEDFFTPWHGILYGGYASLVAWVGLIGYRRRGPTPILQWFPPPYRLAALGLLMFAVGGIGDGIWHTLLGIENGIDALLSPTHLLLFSGGVIALWTPVRSSAARGDTSPALAVGAVVLVTSVLLFFAHYLWMVPDTFYALEPFDPDRGIGNSRIQMFFGGAFSSTAVLFGPLLIISRRWVLPFGAATVVLTTAVGLEALAFSHRLWPVFLAAVAGLAFDTTLVVSRRLGQPGIGKRLAAFAGPAALFSGYLLVAAAEDGPLGWPPEIWCGLVILTGFAGVGLVLIQESGAGPDVAVPTAGGDR